jgi:hypothetical protein
MCKIMLFFIFLLVFSSFVFGVDITKIQGNSFFVDIENDPIFLLDTNASTQCSNDGSLIPLGNGSCVASADLGGGSVSFDTDNQIPYTNAGGDDFDYSDAFKYDGETLRIVGTPYDFSDDVDDLWLGTYSSGGVERGWMFTVGGFDHSDYGQYPLIIQQQVGENKGDIVLDTGRNVIIPQGSMAIGKGTEEPLGGLEIIQDGGAYLYPLYIRSSSNEGITPGIVFWGSRGSYSSPAVVQKDDYLALLSARGYDGAWDWGSAAVWSVQATETWTATKHGTTMALESTTTGGTTRIKLLQLLNGNVLLPHDNEKLLFGAGQDASIKYDGTNLVFTTNEVGSGLAYFSGNISTTGVITRTSVYDKNDGSALDKIKDATELIKDGKIDHKAFYGYVQQEVTDYSKPVNNTYVKCSEDDTGKEICQNVSEISYPYKKVEDGVDLGKEIDVLRQSVFELKEINSELKTELCTFNDKYSWCKIGIVK